MSELRDYKCKYDDKTFLVRGFRSRYESSEDETLIKIKVPNRSDLLVVKVDGNLCSSDEVVDDILERLYEDFDLEYGSDDLDVVEVW